MKPGRDEMLIAGSLWIGAFEGSRWRGGRGRLWVLNELFRLGTQGAGDDESVGLGFSLSEWRSAMGWRGG
jgi:hypothetical protein